MSFLSFLGKVFLLDWLLGDDEEEKIAQPPKPTYDYGREDDYFDKVHSLESRIDELGVSKADAIYSRTGMTSCKTE